MKDYVRGHVSTPKAPGSDQSWGELNAGPYIGTVKNNIDPLRMGRLQVNIPSLSKTADPSTDNLITCEYLSPFYGAKDIRHNIPGSTKYSASQHSYGFWAVPPDIGTRVLVIFAEGKMDEAFWIGCVQEPVTNHMIPGIAASEKTWDKSSGGPAGQFSSNIDKEKTYGTKEVPAGELNRTAPDSDPGRNYDNFNKPIHPLADLLAQQGLSADDVRGTTTSSARRETPSAVMGISTPGRKDLSTTEQPVGTKDAKFNDFVTRGIGHTFVMDDGAVDGTNQLIRLRTATGHQMLLHDTDGVVYIANGSGNSWLEMSPDGKIYIFAQEGFNLRGDGDFELHSGGNISFHAKNDIRFTAEGSVINNAENYLLNIGKKGIFHNAEEGSIRSAGRDGITSYTQGVQLHGAGGRIDLAGAQVHFNSVAAQPTWGPSWLNPDAVGIVTDESQNDVNITVGPGERLEANTAKTKTTVSNLVTHEPFTRAPSAVIETVSQWQDPVKWKQLSETPGTLEYMAQKNRENKNPSVAKTQFLADQQKYISDNSLPPSLRNKNITQKSSTDITSIIGKLQKKQTLNRTELKTLSDTGIYNAREARIAGQSVAENVNANGSVIISKAKRTLKDIDASGMFKGKKTGGFNNLDVGKAKELYDTFAGKYNDIYNVATVIPNLSKDDVGSLIINKVTGGNITSLSAPVVQKQAIKYLSKNIGKFFSRGSANNVPPSMRGTASGKIAQLGATFKAGLSSAVSSIGKFFSDARLKEDVHKIGVSPQGINIYMFKYKHSKGTYQGVLAQEVPWASEMTDSGYWMVDYAKLDVDFRRLN